jgi:hypothetical protein
MHWWCCDEVSLLINWPIKLLSNQLHVIGFSLNSWRAQLDKQFLALMDHECYHRHRQSHLLNLIILGHFNPFNLFVKSSLRHSLTFSSTYSLFPKADISPVVQSCFFHLHFYILIYLHSCLSIYLSTCISACPSLSISVYLSIYMYPCLSIYVYLCLFIYIYISLPIYLCIYVSVCICMYLYI